MGKAGRDEKRGKGAARAPERGSAEVGLPAWVRWGLPLGVFVLAFLPFAASLSFGLVAYDDDRNFEAQFNPWFHQGAHDLSAERLEWMFTASHLGHYQPLTWLSLALDTELAGGWDPGAFHRTNVLLHALNAVLVLWLATRLLRAAFRPRGPGVELRLRLAAAAAALAWGLHPLRVESVAWVTERRDVLSGFFLLLSVLSYLRSVRSASGRWLWLSLSLAGYALSLLSKAWGITLPVVLLVLDLYPLRRRASDAPEPWSRLVGEKLCYVPLALLAALLAARAQGEILAVVPLSEHGVLQRLAQACYGLCFYPLKTLWPSGLSPLYLLEARLDPARPVYLASMAAVAAITGALLVARRRFPAGLATWATYAVLVSPVLGFLQSGSQKVADRYTYLAAIPLSLLVGALALRSTEPREGRASGARLAGVAAATLALAAALGALAWRQTQVWRDSEAVYRQVVEVEPDNYFGQHCLSVILHRAGRVEEAIEHARASVAAHPRKGNEEARYNLGLLLRRAGRPEEALDAFRGAVEVAPDHLASLRQLVDDRLASGDVAGAVALVEDALARAPTFLDGYAELARVQAAAGRPDLAGQALRRGLQVDPGWPQGNHALGLEALQAGRASEAETYLVRALGRGITDVSMLLDLGRAYQAQGKVAEASSCYGQVLALQPQNAQARQLLQALSAGRP